MLLPSPLTPPFTSLPLHTGLGTHHMIAHDVEKPEQPSVTFTVLCQQAPCKYCIYSICSGETKQAARTVGERG